VAMMKDRHKLVIVAPANRWGKSFGVFADAALSATNRHPYCKMPKNSQIYIGLLNNRLIERVVMPKLERLLKRGTYATDWVENVIRINKGDGAGNKIFFVSAEADIKTWESFNANKFYLDEELPKEYVDAVFTRTLDNDGQIIWAMTLEKGLSWSYHEYIEPWLKGKNRHWINIIRGTTWDNPFHEAAKVTRAYERMYSRDPVQAEVRFKGAWLDLTGSPFFPIPGMMAMLNYAKTRTYKQASLVENPS
jgi:hypothetical protein